MNTSSENLAMDDYYCQLCTSTSTVTGNKRLSCFSCDHCHLPMCYNCFNKHTTELIDEYSQLQKRYEKLDESFNHKQQILQTFEEHCIRNVNHSFSEIFNDLQCLQNECVDYVKQQFNDSQVSYFDVLN